MSIAAPENSDFLRVHIQRFTKEQNLMNPKFQSHLLSKDGDNYLGVAYSVKIKGEKNGDVKNFNLIFKCSPRNKELRENLGLRHLYLHEISFYEEKLPILANFLSERNLTINGTPKYFGGCTTSEDEVLILEDLRCYGFSMKKSTMLDYSHALLALQHLGRFHAYSFALRDQKPADFENIKSIEEPFFKEEGLFAENFNILCDVAIKAVESEGQHYVERVRQFKTNIQKLVAYSVDGTKAEPYATLNHGDFWTNNMLFKYNNDGQPEDLCMVDYQIHRYASPALDLSYLFFSCCTSELRNEHYDELLYQYHNSLAQCLRELGSDVEKLFPFEILLDQLKCFSNFGAIMALLALHLFTRQEGESPEIFINIEYLKTLTKNLKTNELYANMMRGTFKDMVDKNYI